MTGKQFFALCCIAIAAALSADANRIRKEKTTQSKTGAYATIGIAIAANVGFAIWCLASG